MGSDVVASNKGGEGGGGSGSAADFLSQQRGTKRGASDSNLTDFERFEKRLRLLSLHTSGLEQNENGKTNVYTPASNAHTTNGYSLTNHVERHLPPQDEMMQVDESKDRIFINDLEAELAEDDANEERLIFLPDIEKSFSRIPQQVLTGSRDGDENQELVLYSIPKSLSADESNDSVRKAIIESRQRAREAAEVARQEDMNRKYDQGEFSLSTETAHGYSTGYEDVQDDPDPDAMDIG